MSRLKEQAVVFSGMSEGSIPFLSLTDDDNEHGQGGFPFRKRLREVQTSSQPMGPHKRPAQGPAWPLHHTSLRGGTQTGLGQHRRPTSGEGNHGSDTEPCLLHLWQPLGSTPRPASPAFGSTWGSGHVLSQHCSNPGQVTDMGRASSMQSRWVVWGPPRWPSLPPAPGHRPPR